MFMTFLKKKGFEIIQLMLYNFLANPTKPILQHTSILSALLTPKIKKENQVKITSPKNWAGGRESSIVIKLSW